MVGWPGEWLLLGELEVELLLVGAEESPTFVYHRSARKVAGMASLAVFVVLTSALATGVLAADLASHPSAKSGLGH